MSDFNLDKEYAFKWGNEVFKSAGLSKKDAEIISDSLVQTSLWGIDSHGIARITHYLSRFETGSIATNPKIELKKTAQATASLDGGDGHGIVLLHAATDYAISLAKDSGVGVIGVSNSSHCGAIGLYTRKITQAGMIGIAFTHSDALVVPHLGRKAFFGTNPISISFPTDNPEEPLCLDMATSIVPWNYIMNAKREGSSVPIGFGVDEEGKDSGNAADIVAVKPTSFHKGYAMAFLIDMLCGPLNGMAFGANITPMYQQMEEKRKLGSLIIAIDPQRFAGLDFVKAACSSAIEQVKSQGDAILFPGEPEYAFAKLRTVAGIPVSQALAEEFSFWSQKLNIHPPMYK